ncbi:sterol desaturase family protein [Aquabacterium sp.]|uniref:sterol desaturase family protein n=1 Tax=Aquabacterium sp. TaxID=1872578 RepID=UPI0037848F21
MVGFLTRWLYVLAVVGSALAWWLALRWGGSLSATVLGASIATLALGVWLERVRPFEAAWRQPRDDRATDATSAVLLIGLVDPLLKAALPLGVVAALGHLPGAEAWPMASWPLGAQVLVAAAWIELAKYLSHRAHHASPLLWPLHALHHGSERLYWLNNFRFHPLNHVVNSVLSLLPLAWLGVPAPVLYGALALTQPVVMLQHLNADLRSGWLNWLFSTNELHRWHHSDQPAEANANYGSAWVLWDHVFGTYLRPQGRRRPARIGLFGSSGRYPAQASYWRQLAAPLRPACCRA